MRLERMANMFKRGQSVRKGNKLVKTAIVTSQRGKFQN